MISTVGCASDRSVWQLIYQLWGLLGKRRRSQIGLVLFIMIVSSVAEVVSLAAVLPFLAVLANPRGLWNNPWTQQLAPWFGITSVDELLLPITILFASAALAAGTIRLLNLRINGQLAASIGSDLSCEAFRRTLYQSYAVHLSRNTSSLISTLSNDVGRVINLVINPLLQLLSSGLIATSLVLTLLVIDAPVAFGVAAVVAIVYLMALAIGRAPLKKLSKQQVELNQLLIQTLQEGLGGIRDVLLDNNQMFYGYSYRDRDKKLRNNGADINFLSSYPRLILEPLGIALIATAGYILISSRGAESALPLLGALALGAQRLLPMSQKVYEGWAMSRSAKDSLANLLELLNQPVPENSTSLPLETLPFQVEICFSRVRFRYGLDVPEVLKGLDFKIKRGERIGLIGSTGSGKSTTMDLMMGLLQPTAGQILVDGQSIYSTQHPARLAAWRSVIGHVPQTIYLADRSFAENIAFGMPLGQIDHDRVRSAAQQAQIASFIESQPLGYSSFVGERGIRLSGGQCQRIGIARALYKQAKVLVFDEATSSLDMTTEKLVMQAIDGLKRDLTVVIIAHRLSTVRGCDRIICLDQGIVQIQGLSGDVLNSLHI